MNCNPPPLGLEPFDYVLGYARLVGHVVHLIIEYCLRKDRNVVALVGNAPGFCVVGKQVRRNTRRDTQFTSHVQDILDGHGHGGLVCGLE